MFGLGTKRQNKRSVQAGVQYSRGGDGHLTSTRREPIEGEKKEGGGQTKGGWGKVTWSGVYITA